MSLFYYNILLSHEYPTGRMKCPSRKKGDWFHSIALFCPIDINTIKDNYVSCSIIHFYGQKGSPVLCSIFSKLRCIGIHHNNKIFVLECFTNSFGVIGHIRTSLGYEEGFGKCDMKFDDIVKIAFEKWGYEQIPYAHQRNESYNCVAFVDDILIMVRDGIWNKRIIDMHEKHRLVL
jgi:hypothetical protein